MEFLKIINFNCYILRQMIENYIYTNYNQAAYSSPQHEFHQI